ncbi:MAG: DUF3379 domain-containing protein [Gammaproteobacteria bacterium]|nr:DUF3379 domain-containing protein [Gammaproteobacteria bacterium]
MDDLEFRRRAYAEPNCQDKDFLDKKNEADENIELVDQLLVFDQQIKRAINITPPEGLAERIILNQALGQHTQNKQRVQVALSMVVSVLLMFGLVFSMLQPWPGINLEQQVLTHVYEELDHLIEKQNKDISHVNRALSAYGVEIKHDFGQVNYLGSCKIANKEGVHIVLAGKKGAITVMMLPQIKVDTEQSVSDGRFQGIITPLGKGSMAILGEKNELLDQIEQKIKNNLSLVI